MEVHLQQCQACLSPNMCNLLVREPGQSQMVYVRCADCGELVARYRLREYYHHGKGIESWLHSQDSAASESGRDFLGEFERVKQEAVDGFQAVTEFLDAQVTEVSRQADDTPGKE
jgi:hypothetical protein